MKDELKPVKQHELTLDELVLFICDRRPKVNFLVLDGKAFARHFAENRDKMIKLKAWGMYAEGGLPLTEKPYVVGFCEFGKYNPGEAPADTVKVPYEFLSRQLGFKIGDRIDKLLMYAEVANPREMNYYVARYPFKQISKRRIREVRRKLNKLLPDSILSDDKD
jgi:hypothetical protein